MTAATKNKKRKRAPIPGSWIDPATARIKFVKDAEIEIPGSGGVVAKRYRAAVADGILLVIVSQDPTPIAKRRLWHISVSHRAGVDEHGEEILTRCPTWDELKRAKYQFAPDDVSMSIVLPERSTKWYVDTHATTLQLWEDVTDREGA